MGTQSGHILNIPIFIHQTRMNTPPHPSPITTPISMKLFHGKSSGLDPLNSYLSLPILINSKDNIEPAGIPSQTENGKGAVFLLDSGSTGETAPMVQIFMENMKQEGFRNMLKDQFVKHTDACVEDFLVQNSFLEKITVYEEKSRKDRRK